MLNRKDLFILITLALVALVLYGYQLHFPPSQYYDEVYHVKNARALFTDIDYLDTHPPLGKELIAISIISFGDTSWVWRLPSVLFGVGVVLLLYLITVSLLEKRLVGVFVCFLCLCDGLMFTTARIALLNSNCAFFILLIILFLIQYNPLGKWSRRKAFFAAGVSFGLLISTKWFGLLLVPLLGLWLGSDFFRAKDKAKYLLDLIGAFFIIPLIIYVVCYLPVARLHSQSLLEQLKFIWQDQQNIWNYHTGMTSSHRYRSQWWQWPFLLRPIWYYFKRISSDMVRGIIALGNPAIFLFIFPGLGYSIYKLFFAKNAGKYLKTYCFIALAGFTFYYFSWAVQPRALIFFHYFYFALIFAIMAQALLFYDMYKSHWIGKVLVLLVFVSIVGLFIYFLPLLNGQPISYPAFKQKMWLKSWI
jgi:dolichyl-phosphate-mannose--protein O-mannosyl transferase